MAMVMAAQVGKILEQDEEFLAHALETVQGDTAALYRASAVARAAGTRAEAGHIRLGTARSGLANAWAAPSGDAMQAATAPIPDAITAAHTLLGVLAAGLDRIAVALHDSYHDVANEKDSFHAFADLIRETIDSTVSDEFYQQTASIGAMRRTRAEQAQQRLDRVLAEFATTVDARTRELAAAQAEVSRP